MTPRLQCNALPLTTILCHANETNLGVLLCSWRKNIIAIKGRERGGGGGWVAHWLSVSQSSAPVANLLYSKATLSTLNSHLVTESCLFYISNHNIKGNLRQLCWSFRLSTVSAAWGKHVPNIHIIEGNGTSQGGGGGAVGGADTSTTGSRSGQRDREREKEGRECRLNCQTIMRREFPTINSGHRRLSWTGCLPGLDTVVE